MAANLKKVSTTPAAKPANVQSVAEKASATATGAPPAVPKAPRKPRVAAITMAQRFELMTMVKEADTALPDAALAVAVSAKLGRVVSQQTVSEYRRQFGLPVVHKPTSAQLMDYVEVLKAALVKAGLPVPGMGAVASEASDPAHDGGNADAA